MRTGINSVKKYSLLPLFFFLFVFSLAAQETMDTPFVREDPSSFRETKIYVPPIDGIGSIEDMAYFFKGITGEITRQYRTLGRTRRTSDYVITGKIMPIAELEEEIEMPPDSEDDENILFIELFDNTMQEIIALQYITYTIPDATTDEALSVIIYNLISGIPDLLEGTGSYDDWRNKRLYLHASFLWTPRMYAADYVAVHNAGIGGQIMADYHFLSWLAVTAGVQVSQDWVTTYSDPNDYVQDMVLYVPLAAKFVFRPGDLFMLEPYLGLQGNFSLLQTTWSFPLAWIIGAQFGVKVGFGIVTLDAGFAMDVGKSAILDPESDFALAEFHRYSLHVGLGFKYGFWDRIKPEFHFN